jgi:4-hydroxybenzoate polyprenyltransferase
MNWCSIVSFVLALLSKETAAALPGILLVFGWFFDSRLARWNYIPHAIVAMVWGIAFREIERQGQTTGFVYNFSVSNILRNYAAYFLDFSNHLLNPMDDIMPARVAALSNMWQVKVPTAVTIVAETAVVVFSRAAKSDWLRIVAFGFAWFLIATLPVAVFNGRLFMRYSYFGHAGLAICAGALVRELARFALRHDSFASNVN